MAERPTRYDVQPEGPRRRYTPEQIDRLRDYCTIEVEDAFAARAPLEGEWRDCLRMYEGRPDQEIVDTPIPNAPNVEIPLGATAADSVYAEGIDLIFQISPTVTARPVDSRWEAHAKALQRMINFCVENEWGMRKAVSHVFADDTQLGTGVYYIPWIEQIRKNLMNIQVVSSGPRLRALAPENFITPGAAPAWTEDARWLAMRAFRTMSELSVLAKQSQWDIEGVKASGSSGLMRQARERHGRTHKTGEETRHLAEILELYVSFDIDDDDIPEDLFVVMDRSSRAICKVRPDPYDRRRPFESMVYQPRPHLFNGIGVMTMLREFERSATMIHNARVLNMFLANCRVWARKEGTANETEEMWPGKNIMCADPANDVRPLAMADVYTSAIQAETILLQYAERRTGVGDLGQGRGASLGSRTPGITALSAIQNVNKRFSPAFDEMRIGTARALQQCLFRYSERIAAGDIAVETRLMRMLGPEDGPLVIELLRQPDFESGVCVELTASSASANRESDRQNAIMLANLLGQYYKQLIELQMMISNPMVTPELKATGEAIIKAAGEAMDRTIRTFDQVRDPATFIIRLEDMQRQTPGPAPSDIAALVQGLGQMPQPGAQPLGPGVAPGTPPNGNGGMLQ